MSNGTKSEFRVNQEFEKLYREFKKLPTRHLTHTGYGGRCWPTCVRDKTRNVRKWLLTSDASQVTCLRCLKIMIERKRREVTP